MKIIIYFLQLTAYWLLIGASLTLVFMVGRFLLRYFKDIYNEKKYNY